MIGPAFPPTYVPYTRASSLASPLPYASALGPVHVGVFLPNFAFQVCLGG
jgi:hypothetical protein